MQIAHRSIGLQSAPFVIAEMSGNHNQSLERALAIVDAAARAGAHALKLQTYTADTMTLAINSGEFFINDERSLWKGKSLHDLYRVASTPWDWHGPIFRRARELGMLCFSTPFDETAVDFLEELEVPCYKIASASLTDDNLLRHHRKYGRPIIMSTGMSTLEQIDHAVEVLGLNDLVILLQEIGRAHV